MKWPLTWRRGAALEAQWIGLSSEQDHRRCTDTSDDMPYRCSRGMDRPRVGRCAARKFRPRPWRFQRPPSSNRRAFTVSRLRSERWRREGGSPQVNNVAQRSASSSWQLHVGLPGSSGLREEEPRDLFLRHARRSRSVSRRPGWLPASASASTVRFKPSALTHSTSLPSAHQGSARWCFDPCVALCLLPKTRRASAVAAIGAEVPEDHRLTSISAGLSQLACVGVWSTVKRQSFAKTSPDSDADGVVANNRVGKLICWLCPNASTNRTT